MANDSIQEQLNKVEAVNMATNIPVHDAVTSLLVEARLGAYSAQGTVDVHNPKSIQLRTSVNGQPDVILDGYANDAQVVASQSGATVRNMMDFGDSDHNFVRQEQVGSNADVSSMSGAVYSKSSDSSGKPILETQGGVAFAFGDVLQSLARDQVTDSSGKTHQALELCTSSLDNQSTVTDIFMLKDGFNPKADETISQLPVDMILGVVHSSVQREGDKATFSVTVQPARSVSFPPLETSL